MSIQDSKELTNRLTQALAKAVAPSEIAAQRDKRLQRLRSDGHKVTNVVKLRSDQINTHPVAEPMVEHWPLPGLAPMTRVRTNFGDVHSIALRKGDEVLTASGEFLPILWLNRIKLEAHILNTKPDSNPIVIGSGTFGNCGELMVSPRQVISADENSGLKESREAATLVSFAGVRRLRETGLTYTMFHVGCAAEVYCEGLYLKFPIEA
ncbi:Hint domain-containing protein [Rhodobacteraceae bacterium]|nr:Hint domain-containing protein [Paracoccaceae bacterium]